jgi:hypothetical protein
MTAFIESKMVIFYFLYRYNLCIRFHSYEIWIFYFDKKRFLIKNRFRQMFPKYVIICLLDLLHLACKLFFRELQQLFCGKRKVLIFPPNNGEPPAD